MRLARYSAVVSVGIILVSELGAWSQDVSVQLEIRDFMTEAQFNGCGLDQLTPDQLGQLNDWLSRYTLYVIEAVSQRPAEPGPTGTPLPTQPTGGITHVGALEGASVVAQDGQYLGLITQSTTHPDSIANRFGDYGSRYSAVSILNRFGDYGGRFSDLSPFYPFASRPPIIVKDRQAVAFLTVSRVITPRVDPNLLLGYLGRSRE